MQFNYDKIKLPYNLEFEKKLLGSLIMTSIIGDGKDYEPAIAVQDIIDPQDFYDPKNTTVYIAIISLIKERNPIDLVGIFEKIKSTNTQISEPDMGQYIGELSQSVITSVNYKYYANEIKKLSERRKFIRMCWEYSKSAAREECIDNFLSDFQNKIINIKNVKMDSLMHVKDFIGDVLCDINEEFLKRANGTDSVYGLQTGLPDLDKRIGGLREGNQIVIAARPGEGKTTFGQQICSEIAKQGNILIFSYEMSKSELASRLISSIGKINLRAAKTKEDGALILRTGEKIERLNIYIDDSKPSWNKLEARCRRFSYEYDLSAIMIDYLQLIPTIPGLSRYESVTEMSRQSKRLAGELQCVSFVISQLGRDTEKRASKGYDYDRPRLSDLRDSGAIEQDADMVLFLHRDSKEIVNQFEDDLENKKQVNNDIELICAKFRNGSPFTETLYFDREHMRFYCMCDKDYIQSEMPF